MNKLSKLLIMTLVVLAVIAMSLTSYATTQSLVDYINAEHTVGAFTFNLTASQKSSLTTYITKNVNDETADSIMKDITSVEDIVKNSGAAKLSDLSSSTRSQILDIAKSACAKAGLTLTASTNSKYYKVTDASGNVIISGNYSTNASRTLLYTGSNVLSYAVPALAVVAVAAIIKKRA